MASRKLKLEDQIGQARQAVEAGDIEQSIAMCRHIFRYYPRCLEVTRMLGEAYTEKRLLDEAEKLLNLVLDADPQDVLGYVDKGFVAYERNQLDEAIASYERALELDPNIEQLRGELLRLNRERYGDNRSKLRLTRAGLANRRLRDGYFTQAIEEYSAILRDTPQRMDIRVGLLEAYWRNKDYIRAENIALEMLQEQPYLIKANLILWQIYGVRRRLEIASTYIERAQMLDPLNSIAEHLFEDTEASDNALSYLSMLEAPTIPAFDPAEEGETPANWLPEWIDKGLEEPQTEIEPELASPGDESQSVSLADLGLDSDLIMSLIADSEQHTAERLNLAQQEQLDSTAQRQEEALNNLDNLRKDASEEGEFGGWLEELSANAPQIDLNALNDSKISSVGEVEDSDIEGIEPFDLQLGQQDANLYSHFDDLVSKEAVATNNDFKWDEYDSSKAKSGLAEDNLIYAESEWQEFDFDQDVQPFDLETAIASTNTNDTVVQNPKLSNDLDEPLDFAVDQQTNPVPGLPNAQLADYAFELRDERGPIPDFVVEAAKDQQIAPSANSQQQVPKENLQMPIKKGGNEDNDLFDWEKEELPDYLQAFAMDDDEVASYNLANPSVPQADITTPPARIQPRDNEKAGVNEMPEWLNPGSNRGETVNRQGSSENIDLSGGSNGNLPSWLDAAEMEDSKEGSSLEDNEMGGFDLDGIKPFSPFSNQSFATPQTPSQTGYNNTNPFPMPEDISPFNLNSIDSSPPARAATPPTPVAEPKSFDMGDFDDLGLGDLQPFNPEGGASTVTPASAMQNKNQPVPPPVKQEPPAQPFSTTQPSSFSRQNTPPPPNTFDDLSDLQPFDFNNPQGGSSNASGNQFNPKPFEPNFPQMPNLDNNSGGFQNFDIGDVKPFSLENFAEPSRPASAQNNTPFNPPPFTGAGTGANSFGGGMEVEDDFNFNDSLGRDLEPFSMESFGDIPGFTNSPTKFGNMTNLPDEPFFPSQGRRANDGEQLESVEPGHEAPLRQFPWMKNRNDSNKSPASEDREQDGTMFKRLAERRKQEMEAQGIAIPANASGEEEDLAQPILSFDEIEVMSHQSDKPQVASTPPAEPVTSSNATNEQPSVAKANKEINDQLNQGLEDHSFNSSLDAALQQPQITPELPSQKFDEVPELPDFDTDFGLEPFNLAEISSKPEETNKATPVEAQAPNTNIETEPDLPDFNFDFLSETKPKENATQEPATKFEFANDGFDLAAAEPSKPNNSQHEDLASFKDFEAISGRPNETEDLFAGIFNEPMPADAATVSPEPPNKLLDLNTEAKEAKVEEQPNATQAETVAQTHATQHETAEGAHPSETKIPEELHATESETINQSHSDSKEAEHGIDSNLTPVAELELPPVQIMPTPPQTVRQPDEKAVRAETPVHSNEQAQATVVPSSPAASVEQPVASSSQNTESANTLDSYLQLVKNNPRDAGANIELAEMYYKQGQVNQAITYFTGAIKLSDKPALESLANKLRGITNDSGSSPRFHHVLGDVYMKQGQHSLALSEYKLALSNAKAR